MSFMPSFKAVFRLLQPDLREQAAAVYSQLMTQARHPWFYREAAVPDTLDGRFEMLVLHLFAYVRQFHESTGDASTHSPLVRAVMEMMIDDMDQALREMGVGDMGVSRRIKRMGDAINGRLHAYSAALSENHLAEALIRNVYGTVAPEEVSSEAVQALQNYVLRLIAHLETQSPEALDFSGLL